MPLSMYMRLSTRKSVTDTGARDDVGKEENSETLENFSGKLEVEGRSLAGRVDVFYA